MTHKLEISGMNGTAKTKPNAVIIVTNRLPKRTVKSPANGIALMAPAAEHRRIVPNVVLETPYKACTSGSRATQLAY